MYTTEIRNLKSRKFPGASTTRLGEVYTEPGQAILTTQADSRDTYLVREMHRLSQLIYSAKQANDVATVQTLLAQFRPLADEYRDRGSIGVSPFDTFIISTGEWIQKTAAAVPGVISGIGVGAIKSLWPFALIAGGILYFKSKL